MGQVASQLIIAIDTQIDEPFDVVEEIGADQIPAIALSFANSINITVGIVVRL
jgi:hypothetical protein